jgi:pimeloyl-ACP methyl ester carboxylesterase
MSRHDDSLEEPRLAGADDRGAALAAARMSLPADEFRTHLEQSATMAGVPLSDLTLPREHHVILGRMRFHYLDWGTAGRPPVLFLHGGGLNAHTWDLVCAALRQERHCLALDQRGHGESEWSPEMDYTTESHVADLDAFVRHRALDRFVLVGMSLGGVNALAWAGRQGDRLAGLVLVDVGPEVRTEGVRKIAAFTSEATPLDSVEAYVDRALAFNPRRNRELLRRSLLHNLRRMPDGRFMWKYDQRHRGKVDPEAYARRRALLWSAVERVACPTLVVRGAQSDVFHDEDAERLAGRLRQGRWARVDGAGHTVQGDNPAGLLVHLRAFLAEVATD